MPAARRYWLMKSEPEELAIDELEREPRRSFPWTGVRNYQARNFLRDQVQLGDLVFFYHSSCAVPGIVGTAEVTRAAYPDPTQFEKASGYFDASATPEAPRWISVDVRFVSKFETLTPSELRTHAPLKDMITLRKGNRLSVTPVTPSEWKAISAIIAKKR
ncbi:MAG: EVE domain-containing protein [Burkholderiaceae bacterium]|jgi:predicted RNA-binding protein with PUA-like domain